jgi:hypothetical protein
MKRHRLVVGLVLALALAPSISFTPAAVAAGRGDVPVTTEPAAVAVDGASSSAGTDTVGGAMAAVLCGLFAKAVVATGGMSAGVWAGAVSVCAYMVFDALTDRG